MDVVAVDAGEWAVDRIAGELMGRFRGTASARRPESFAAGEVQALKSSVNSGESRDLPARQHLHFDAWPASAPLFNSALPVAFYSRMAFSATGRYKSLLRGAWRHPREPSTQFPQSWQRRSSKHKPQS